MWPQLAASLFGGSLLGWLSHALYVRPQQLKGAPTVVAGAVQGIENGLVQPLVTGLAGQALQNIANPAAATPLPSGASVGQAVTVAALNAITTALTGPHTNTLPAPVAPVTKSVAPAPAPAPSMDDSSLDQPTGDSGAPPAVTATF